MRTRVRALSLAIALAAGVVTATMATGVASAAPTQPDINQMCTFTRSNGHIDFYMPGEIIYNPYTGKRQKCGTDGHWQELAILPGTGSGGTGVGGPSTGGTATTQR